MKNIKYDFYETGWKRKQVAKRLQPVIFFNVPKTGFEPAHRLRHYHLKVACLPISPPGLRPQM